MSVTKIIFKQNRPWQISEQTPTPGLPAADSTCCGEPLFYRNKLYIRGLTIDQVGATEDERAAMTGNYEAGQPIFIGPYDHPIRITGSQLAHNVTENTQSATEDYIYTGPGAISNNWRWYRTLTGIVVDKEGHVITAEAGLSIQLHPSSVVSIPRFKQTQYDVTLAFVNSSGHGAVGNQFPIGFALHGNGYIDPSGALQGVDNGPGAMDQDYTWSLSTGDCIAVTDADWSTHTDSNSGYTTSDYNHMLVRSKIAFDTSDQTKYLRHDGQWGNPSASLNISASTGDTTVKGVVAGSVTIDNVETQFTVQPANSNFGAASGEYYYTGQGVVRPIGTTTGIRSDASGKKALYSSELTSALNALKGTVLKSPAQREGQDHEGNQIEWAIIPVYVDYHRVDGTNRVEAVPYIMLPKELFADCIERYFWNWLESFSGNVEGTDPEGSNAQYNPQS